MPPPKIPEWAGIVRHGSSHGPRTLVWARRTTGLWHHVTHLYQRHIGLCQRPVLDVAGLQELIQGRLPLCWRQALQELHNLFRYPPPSQLF